MSAIPQTTPNGTTARGYYEAIVLTFTRERETKSTFRFAEQHAETEDPVVGTLYVRKPALAKLGNPESLSVAIERTRS